jgi:hypothetical protein
LSLSVSLHLYRRSMDVSVIYGQIHGNWDLSGNIVAGNRELLEMHPLEAAGVHHLLFGIVRALDRVYDMVDGLRGVLLLCSLRSFVSANQRWETIYLTMASRL